MCVVAQPHMKAWSAMDVLSHCLLDYNWTRLPARGWPRGAAAGAYRACQVVFRSFGGRDLSADVLFPSTAQPGPHSAKPEVASLPRQGGARADSLGGLRAPPHARTPPHLPGGAAPISPALFLTEKYRPVPMTQKLGPRNCRSIRSTTAATKVAVSADPFCKMTLSM